MSQEQGRFQWDGLNRKLCGQSRTLMGQRLAVRVLQVVEALSEIVKENELVVLQDLSVLPQVLLQSFGH